MRRILMFMGIVALVYGCTLPPKPHETQKSAYSEQLQEVDLENEEYVMITTAVTMPMYMNRDQKAFRKWGNERGVKISILGPAEWDISTQINIIEEVIGTRPTGLLINGTDPALAPVINKAVAAGIPTVVYDSDIPNANYDAFLGTDWYEIGLMQGEEMARLINGKGKVAYMGILGMSNMESGFQGYLDVLSKYPDIEVVGKYDSKANTEEAAKISSDIISAYPDIAGISGFDGPAGPGIGLAVKEAGMSGKIKITTVDGEPEHLQLVKDGTIQMLAAQKRELFTWYGAQFLYDMVHGTNRLSSNDSKAGITSIPYQVNTGLIKITIDNVDMFMQ